MREVDVSVADPASLDYLLNASEEARAAASRAIARSEALLPIIRDAHERSVLRRVSSRPRQAFVRIQGTIDGLAVTGVVRVDGSVAGTSSLLRRAELLVAMGERFHSGRIAADVGKDPLATSLTLIRACDWVNALELVTSAARGMSAPGVG